MSAQYTIDKPRLSGAFYFFAAAASLALAALFWSAFRAFELTMETGHAVIAAIAFETAAAAEAVALARARRLEDYPIPALFTALSVIGSGVYNFAQVQAHGEANGLTNPLFLSVFAIGPLVAMIGLAMNAGRELRAHESAVAEWARNKQLWIDANVQRTAAQQRATEEQQRFDQLRAQREAADRAQQLDLERIRAQQAATLAPLAVAGGDAPQSPKLTTAQRVAQWREKHPGGTRAECARDLGVHRSTVGAQWKD